MVDSFQQVFLRADVALRTIARRPLRKYFNPFEDETNPPLIIHCCYHKVGTVWFKRILRDVSAEFGLKFQLGKPQSLTPKTDVFLDHHSQVNIDKIPHFIGSHIIRDPRDIIVSRYFYHLWTHEKWAKIPQEQFGGLTYKAYLNSLDKKKASVLKLREARILLMR